MKEVFSTYSGPRHDFEMTALAYYTAAVCEKEREHMPIIGPSIDRRTLTLVCRVAGSDNIQSLMCFCCNQIHTRVSSWERMCSKNPDRRSEIQMYDVKDSLLRLAENDWEAFCLNFSCDLFRDRYATDDAAEGNPFKDAEELRDGNYEWRRRVLVDKARIFEVLCCPEDCEKTDRCKHPDGQLCKFCRIPLCWQCAEKITKEHGDKSIPMSLCNDNFWGYTCDLIAKYQVRWIEAAIVSPCWTNMVVYYIEGDYGHLMNEELGQQRFRTVVRGSPISFLMPWEDILKDLQKNCLDDKLLELPRPQECLKYLLRVHIRVNATDFAKHLKQVHVRPFVLVQLLNFLIDRQHEVFRGKASAMELKRRMAAAVAREYPETEAHKDWGQREGAIPAVILEALREAEAEKDTALSAKRRVLSDKNATPGDGPRPLDKCLDDIRPVAITLDRSTQASSDPGSLRQGAVERYGDLHVQTGSKPILQWHSKSQ